MTIEAITGRTRTPQAIQTTQKADIDSGKKASVNNAGRADSIAITATAQGLKKAFESSSSVVDIDKVAATKKALADGSYRFNAERTAEKLIQYDRLMP